MPRSLLRLAPVVYCVAFYAFIFLPVVVLVLFSFQGGSLPVPPIKGLSLKWYAAAFGNSRVVAALVNSIVVALLSSLVATVLGFLSAYGLARYKVRMGTAVQWLMMSPITVSYLIVGFGLMVTLKYLGVQKSLLTVGIGHVVINLPIAFSIILSQMGGHQVTLERAARDLGASDAKVLWLVTVPVLWPAIFAAFCLSATLSWDEFIIAFLLSRTDVTMPVEIWSMLRTGLNPETNAVGAFVFLLSVATFLLFETILFRRRK